MKLRNKKTGGIFDVAFHSSYKDGKITIGVEVDADPKYPKCNFSDYESLEEFNANWEDYKPAESLIKDEKTRKVVRAWAECCCVPLLKHYFSNGFSCFICKDEEDNEYCLDFTFRIDNLAPEHIYTIAELCGEEEE